MKAKDVLSFTFFTVILLASLVPLVAVSGTSSVLGTSTIPKQTVFLSMSFRFICGGRGTVILEVDDIKKIHNRKILFLDLHDIVGLDKYPLLWPYLQVLPSTKNRSQTME